MMINTKYGKKTLAVILLWMFSMTILIGCASSNLTAPTNSPEVTPVATPTIAPTPTAVVIPEPTPKPTHQPDLSLEEERALLGVNDENDLVQLDTVLFLCLIMKDTNGNTSKRMAWIFIGVDMNSKYGIYDVWSRKKIFDLYAEANEGDVNELVKTATPANKRLVGSEIIAISGFANIRDFYEKMGMNVQLPSEINQFLPKPYIGKPGSSGAKTEGEVTELPKDAFLDLYILCTPKEFRTSWMDFDESLISSSESPKP